MNVEARISKQWRRRMLFMLFMLFGISAWFFSDGYHYWPKEAERHAAYMQILDSLVASGNAKDADSSSVQLAWQRHAKEAGYKGSKVPKERTEAAIAEQRNIAWVLLIVSVLFATWVAWNHRLSVSASSDTIIGTKGQRVKFDSIEEIDRKKWKSKGIAYAVYRVGDKKRRLTLDAHKFNGCEAIITEADRRISERAAVDNEQSVAESGEGV
ncbi:MAG: hypothetical protein VXX82_06280 [Verrucomicrobiota bacterium]|nr:hypothetical protein [Verrucomicrobiota bacterium]